jgi:carbamoyltransferase
MKGVVNGKIKFREAFRPFAPSLPIEKATKYFDTKKEDSFPFRFMLYVAPVKKDRQEELGAVTHKDGTARPQFVDKNIHPLYHKLIYSFGKKTGTPVLLNTSFNLRGEPIVNTTEEAYATFMKSGIDTLVVKNFVVEKK